MKIRIFASIFLLGLGMLACAIPVPTPTLAPVSNPAEEAAVRAVVEGFGEVLKMVALLSPTAAQDIQLQYGAYVAPDLLNQWVNDLTQAPGKLTSSPWPERITITTLTKNATGGYDVSGTVDYLTSVEVTGGGVAYQSPVQITVEMVQGQWMITAYAGGQ
jgi:hypothetical protein